MSTLPEQYEAYRSNALPGMIAVLAEQLHVSAASLEALGVGWKIDENAWVFPERSAEGGIVGLVRRFWDGKKFCVSGSKRGVVFVPSPVTEGYHAASQQWLRVTKTDPCPICEWPDWCGIDGNIAPPRFVRCMRRSEGSVFTCAAGGWIHELLPGSFRPPSTMVSILPGSDLPVVVVEGATDVAAGIDLGFVVVGKPSAEGGTEILLKLLRGRSVIVLGENDAGAGRRGMEKTFESLRPVCSKVVKVMPPEEVKDLRAWVQQGLTQDGLLAAARGGSTDSDSNLLEATAPLAIAELWLRTERYADGVPAIRKWNGAFWQYDGHGYSELPEDMGIRGPLYRFLKDKTYLKFSAKGEASMEKFVATRSKISDIVDALNMSCPVQASPPCWLDDRADDPRNFITFQNGVLALDAYMAGRIELLDPTPLLFHMDSTPYSFDPTAKCPNWLKFVGQIFQNDPERTMLLQEWFGYNMVADTTMEKFMLFVGRPGSGKSTTLDVLRAILGRGQCARSSFEDLCSRFGRQPLMGRLAIILPDAHVPRGVDSVKALEIIKSIVGRDGITIDQKFRDQLPEVQLLGRITIGCNELPELPDTARSLERRLLLLYFPDTFEGREDCTLKDRLPLEAPGIAIWALEGLRRLRKNGVFTTPTSSIPVIDEFRRGMTPIAEFIDECCTVGSELWVPRGQAYDCWYAWARARGVHPSTRSKFGQRLLHQLPGILADRMRKGDGERLAIYSGVGLDADAVNKYLGGR